jgi:hypothetical protein
VRSRSASQQKGVGVGLRFAVELLHQQAFEQIACRVHTQVKQSLHAQLLVPILQVGVQRRGGR